MEQENTNKNRSIQLSGDIVEILRNSEIYNNSDFVTYDTNIFPTDNTTYRQNLALQNARNYFNKNLFEKVFEKSLGPVMIRPAKHGKAYGYYLKAAWKEGIENPVPEISLCPCGLHRSPEAVYSTLVHELVHQYQDEHGYPGRGCYHNLEFSRFMAQVGLICSNTGEPGGKKTGDQMTHYIDPDGLFKKVFVEMPDDYLLPFTPLFDKEHYGPLGLGAPLIAPEPINNKNKTKYTCLGCHSSVWGKPSMNIICGVCKTQFSIVK